MGVMREQLSSPMLRSAAREQSSATVTAPLPAPRAPDARTAGVPLADLRGWERRFGQDFSSVRMHSDDWAAGATGAVGAPAYTLGEHVVFGADRYSPSSSAGQWLIAHELAHVVQQRRGGAPPSGDPGAESERSADAVANTIALGAQAVAVPGATGVGIARAPMHPPHARGAGGEQGMGFEHYPASEGWVIIEGPSGIPVPGSGSGGGHGVNAKGFDAIAYNTKTLEVHLVDNKSLKTSGNVSSATAIDPSQNLANNIDDAIQRIEASQDVTGRIKVLEVLKKAKAALKAGQSLPSELKLIVTGVGGQKTGVSARLASEGVQFGPGSGPPAGPSKTFDEAAAIEKSPAVQAHRKLQAEKVAAPKPTQTSEPAPAITPPSAKSDPLPAVKPSAGEPHGSSGAPPRAGGGRLGGAVKFAGPMVLDMVTAYYVNKHEQKVIAKAVTDKVDSPDVKNRVVEEVEKNRADIAYKQLRGAIVYATVELRMSLTNDIMNDLQLKVVRITDNDQSETRSSVMSHDAIVGGEHSTRWDTISMPIPTIEVSESEELKLRLRALDESRPSQGSAPPAGAREKLLVDIATAEKAEAREREAEIERPRVLADPKARAKQQAELLERMRKQNEKAAPAAPKTPTPPSPELFPTPGGATAGPGPLATPGPTAAPGPTGGFAGLLPGAPPGEGPIEKAAKAVSQAKEWTHRIHASGVALESRLGGANRPTDAERQAWVAEEAKWRIAMKAFMNYFHNESRQEAVTGLGQLVDEYGPKFAQLHIHLVG